MVSELCPVYAVSQRTLSTGRPTSLLAPTWGDGTTIPFFGAMGCTCAIVFTCLGASYGTAKSGVGIAAMGVLRPDLIVKSAHLPHPHDLDNVEANASI
ncbi:V-type proton ATPase proteolipid subunit [Metarhizium anisopliae]